ncbi:helix-turn-helix transcriptional regulator [Sphingomonas sp. AOB5]|uniref:helix-turn-helix transcriptional regulator n=1 Tax=Sphingomonas sp. AOB5 TaxID=3034017 RepID=UPI0023F7E5AA|nr:helix-turn-helix transcriptional regulator [Sphingomonas sp. AOB5]MDF7774617.1 helix-turn-helix transcriptional regulator [Sphingomonas sp. AOB5]
MAKGHIANQIRTLRFMAGEMTQAELGERIGLTRQTVAAIEQGKYSPTLEAAFRIAMVFGKPLDEVFQWEEG